MAGSEPGRIRKEKKPSTTTMARLISAPPALPDRYAGQCRADRRPRLGAADGLRGPDQAHRLLAVGGTGPTAQDEQDAAADQHMTTIPTGSTHPGTPLPPAPTGAAS